MTFLLTQLLKAYRRWISPMYPPRCKYFPSCSEYSLISVQTHGAIKGVGLTLWRIIRCNPFSLGGYDPVPGTQAAVEWEQEQAGQPCPTEQGVCL
ncbi:MAG: membrane protein insertion efficiency factor YidD [Propionibacteriaceae bacterium]|nr:membrane protein insertion efficiency factor YidD [Propionibacteriaceae bacterium]